MCLGGNVIPRRQSRLKALTVPFNSIQQFWLKEKKKTFAYSLFSMFLFLISIFLFFLFFVCVKKLFLKKQNLRACSVGSLKVLFSLLALLLVKRNIYFNHVGWTIYQDSTWIYISPQLMLISQKDMLKITLLSLFLILLLPLVLIRIDFLFFLRGIQLILINLFQRQRERVSNEFVQYFSLKIPQPLINVGN